MYFMLLMNARFISKDLQKFFGVNLKGYGNSQDA